MLAPHHPPAVPVHCRAHHGSVYCAALEHRHAIRVLRVVARREETRTHKPHHRFTINWVVPRLRRTNARLRSHIHWLRTIPTWRPPLSASPLYRDFLCIHHYEGAWNDAGDPYWGGLQMDRSFMLTYGSDMVARYQGWANVWPPDEQIRVAMRAWRSRGFSPWPNTARSCGLL